MVMLLIIILSNMQQNQKQGPEEGGTRSSGRGWDQNVLNIQ